MFLMSISGIKRNKKLKFVAILSVCALAALVAVRVVTINSGDKKPHTDFETNLSECGSVEGFLRRLGLECEDEISHREITLPDEDDRVFSQYCDFLKNAGFRLMEFSRKRVEERYLKLKNKTPDGKPLYAVVLTCKGQVAGAHLTTLLENSGIMQICDIV